MAIVKFVVSIGITFIFLYYLTKTNIPTEISFFCAGMIFILTLNFFDYGIANAAARAKSRRYYRTRKENSSISTPKTRQN